MTSIDFISWRKLKASNSFQRFHLSVFFSKLMTFQHKQSCTFYVFRNIQTYKEWKIIAHSCCVLDDFMYLVSNHIYVNSLKIECRMSCLYLRVLLSISLIEHANHSRWGMFLPVQLCYSCLNESAISFTHSLVEIFMKNE